MPYMVISILSPSVKFYPTVDTNKSLLPSKPSSLKVSSANNEKTAHKVILVAN